MKRGVVLLWLIAVAAAAASFLVHLTLCFENVRLGYDVDDAHRQQRGLQELRRKLSLEEATLSQPDRIAAVARALDMEQPKPEQITMMLGGPAAPELARHVQ